ncbi:MAG: amylo-alpha-1,6-glucosidase [Actinobacteria bacterium]|nr:amylo-alpha-1,6-glucosidase [Actinomycetota bacterium]
MRPESALRSVPAKTPGIDDLITTKNGNLFFLSRMNGDVPLSGDHAAGLYYHDCRFLDGYELRLAGQTMEPLVSSATRGSQALIELTNPDLTNPDGEIIARQQEIGIKWLRTLDGDSLSLHDALSFRNFGLHEVRLPVTLRFRAGFQDIFSVRSLLPGLRGTVDEPVWEGDDLVFLYRGCDGLARVLRVRPWHSLVVREGSAIHMEMVLPPREELQVRVSLSVAESDSGEPAEPPVPQVADLDALARAHSQLSGEWLSRQTSVSSSNLLVDKLVERSFRDLYLLQSSIAGEEYYAAGIPWFATLFGRDSIISALQTLAFDASIAEQTLRILAHYQGRHVDPWREEQTGKILHELRVGEMANSGQVPHSPYYGSIDATPLFLILVAEHAAWTGDLSLFHELGLQVESSLQWLSSTADEDGYLRYQGTAEGGGLLNQGWKDSENGILNADGSVAEPPIALVEVQAYAYMARQGIAGLYRRAGDPVRAAALEQEAEDLRLRFNRDFWMDRQGCYALALQKGGRQARVSTSNAGHTLWAGIADPDKARRVQRRLMKPDLFSGWGIRTLSAREMGYSPVGYHVGTVWPHDNSLIAAGFRRYGFDQAALRLFSGMVEAAMHFDLYRLPELFAGFSRRDYEVPVHYPLANKPQAWAAAAIPHMLQSLLGLQAEAMEHRLRIERPVLPGLLEWVQLHQLRVGECLVDLRFQRTRNGVAVQVERKDRALDVIIEL